MSSDLILQAIVSGILLGHRYQRETGVAHGRAEQTARGVKSTD
jgi:hypothetical protein